MVSPQEHTGVPPLLTATVPVDRGWCASCFSHACVFIGPDFIGLRAKDCALSFLQGPTNRNVRSQRFRDTDPFTLLAAPPDCLEGRPGICFVQNCSHTQCLSAADPTFTKNDHRRGLSILNVTELLGKAQRRRAVRCDLVIVCSLQVRNQCSDT